MAVCMIDGKPYKRDAVYQSLVQQTCEQVLAADIGAGEFLLYLYYRDRSAADGSRPAWNTAPVTLDGENKQPTYLAIYKAEPGETETVLIGNSARTEIEQAGTKFRLYEQFKKSPREWDKKADETHTHRDLMLLFLQKLFQKALRKDEVKFAFKRGKLLIAAGCPASEAWLSEESRAAYEALLREASGCQNVTVIAESTAAVSAALSEELQLRRITASEEDADEPQEEQASQEGEAPQEETEPRGDAETCGEGDSDSRRIFCVALFDLGSSTMDYTFVFMGKALYTASLPIAGYCLDVAMWRQLSIENWDSDRDGWRDVLPAGANAGSVPDYEKCSRIYRSIELNEFRKALLILRRAKEQYYRIRAEKRKTGRENEATSCGELDISLRCRDGRSRKLRFVLDDAFMEHAINYRIPEEELRFWDRAFLFGVENYNHLSWRECCNEFFKDSYNETVRRLEVQLAELPQGAKLVCKVRRVGGTSFVTDTEELCRNHFGANPYIRICEPDEENVDVAVARGIAIAKGHEAGVIEQIKDVRAEMKSVTELAFQRAVDGIAKEYADAVWEESRQILYANNCGERKRDSSEIGEELKQACSAQPFKERFAHKIANQLAFHAASCQPAILEKVNKLSEALYGAAILQLDKPQILQATVIDGIPKNLSEELFTKVINPITVLDRVGQIIGQIFFMLGMFLYDLFKEFVPEDDYDDNEPGWNEIDFTCNAMTGSRVRKQISRRDNSAIAANTKKKFRDTLLPELRKSAQLREVFFGIVDEQLEIAVGKILLLAFDEQPELKKRG